MDTRAYMRSLHGAADALLLNFGSSPSPRVGAVEAAPDHMCDMFRLSRRDNMAFLYIVPALYVTFERDQETYDFMKWAAKSEDSYYVTAVSRRQRHQHL